MLNNKHINKVRETANGSGQTVILKTARDINRYLIFEMLVRQTVLTIGDIVGALKLSLPLASRQLKALEQINILEKEKRGRKFYYKFKADNAVAQAIING